MQALDDDADRVDAPLPQTREEARALDDADPLAPLRDAFALPKGVIYLDGNSLGPPTHASLARLAHVAHHEWGRGLIASWEAAGWMDLPVTAGAKIARLLGAPSDSVIVTDSVSIDLFKLAAALAALKPARRKILIAQDEFPTDRYMMAGLARLTGMTLSDDPYSDDVAVAIRSAVHYRSAALADMRAEEQGAATHGVPIVWDLSHAVGLMPLDLPGMGAKFAVGCGYKFLNGGPGAPAFVFVSPASLDGLENALAGWMGHADPFAFAPAYAAAPGVRRFTAGTPPILSMAALDASLDIFANLDLKAVHVKAMRLGDIFLDQTRALNIASLSPGIGAPRGGHVSLMHSQAEDIIRKLAAKGVIADFRPPDLMRFGFAPLFLRYVDAWDAAAALISILRPA